MAAKQKLKEQPKLLEKSLDDYYFARMNEKVENYEHIYHDILYAPATEMERARREIACLDNQLVRARQHWIEEKADINKRWDDCSARFDAFYNGIPQFNGYYKDSFAKRERSVQAYLREKTQSLQKDQDMRRLTKELEKLLQVKNEVEIRLEKFSCFRIYLEKVKQSTQGEYQDIREIIDRYSILDEARGGLGGRNEETRTIVARKQKALETDIVTKSNEVLAYRNYLSELLEYHDMLQEKVQQLDDGLLRIKTTAAQRTMIIGQIKMSIDNLYKQVCKAMHRPPKLPQTDTLGQLSDVGLSVREIFKLSKDIKHMLKAAFNTAEAEKAAQLRARRKEEERQKRIDKYMNSGKTDVPELFGLPPGSKGLPHPKNKRDSANNPTTNTATGTATTNSNPHHHGPRKSNLKKTK